MSPSISSRSSGLSVYWTRSISPASLKTGSHSSNLDIPPRDGADEPRSKPNDKSSPSSNASSQRQKFVFGAPTSRALTEDAISTIALETNGASNQLGMGTLRGAEGKPFGMRTGSVSGLPDSAYIGGSAKSLSRGPKGSGGSTGWVMYEEGGPGRSSVDRRRSLQLKKGGRISDDLTVRMDGRANEILSLSKALSSTHPGESTPWGDRRGSTGRNFNEGFPPVRPTTPMQWIRQKTTNREGKVKTGEKGGAAGIAPDLPPLPKFWKKKYKRRLPPIDIPPDERRLKKLSPRTEPSTATSPLHNGLPISASSGESMAVHRHTRPNSRLNSLRSSISFARHRFSSAFVSNKSSVSSKHSNDSLALAGQRLPPRPATAPPGDNPKALEYPAAEARGIMTPEELPIFSPTNVGGQILPRSIEMGYFDRMDMIQSHPPMSLPGELSLVLEPSEQPKSQPMPQNPLHAFPNIASVAPFLVQDLECDRSTASSPTPLAPAFVRAQGVRTALLSATASKIRRMSLAAKERASGRKLSDVSEVSFIHHHDGKKVQMSELLNDQSVNKSRRSIISWIKQSTEAGVVSDPTAPPTKSIEVELEEKRREKRDTGVIGLATPVQSSESSGHSVSYAAVSREIAGVKKKPNRKSGKEKEEMFIGLGGSATQAR